jgi:uncharacterized damage-inducible protein DinB
VTAEQLRWSAAYNGWANARLLEAATALSEEEFERDLRASFGSLKGTLAHLLWGERGWLRFWQVGDFIPQPISDEQHDFASLRSAWGRHEEAYESYMIGLTQAELDTPRTLDATIYTLGELVQHALNHSTYHRGQVALLMRQLGHAPPATDCHDFLAEARVETARSYSDVEMDEIG